jgi:metallo-beta-lactamase class B
MAASAGWGWLDRAPWLFTMSLQCSSFTTPGDLMHLLKTATAAALLCAARLACAATEDPDIQAIACDNCAAWNRPQQPFKVAGNTWYVGTAELSALLVTGPQGHILLDGALPQSAPLIEQNIRALGFRLADVKLIVNSHAHFDHAGGIAALQKKSGARVAASVHGAQVLRDGALGPDDPPFDPAQEQKMPRVPAAGGVADGATLRVGSLEITAHLTPGHTLGSTTWTWTSCEGGRCLAMVYADSVTPVSAEGFRYTGARAEQLRASIDRIGALKCDVIVSPHPDFTNTLEKQAARTASHNTFVTPDGCRSYAAQARQRLDTRLAAEAKPQGAGAQHQH